MFNPTICTALLASVCALAACDRDLPRPGTPMMSSGQPPPPMRDSSVPSADSVLTSPAPVAASEAAGTRTNRAMSRAEESAAMPMAGQAGDHSAPLSPRKGAAAP
jgi:hypothetical protein